MNLLLVKSSSIENNRASIRGRQLHHLRDVQRAQVGDAIQIGEVNGRMGRGIITSLNAQQAMVALHFNQQAPAALPLSLILALPRPKMLRRTLQTVAAMGVKKIYLINSSRVEKSFWQSPLLRPEAIEEQLILGLEQARDTLLPNIYLRPLFKPFVEDELGEISSGTEALVAHPATEKNCPINRSTAVTLAVGPEGGFIPYEIDKLNQLGFQSVHLGPRILRVENAVPALISRLFPS